MQKDIEIEDRQAPSRPGPNGKPETASRMKPGDPPPAEHHTRHVVLVVVLVCAVIILPVAWVIHRRHVQQAAATRSHTTPDVPVTLVTVKQGPIGKYVNGLGAVTPVYTVGVSTRVDGQVMSVNYTEGQEVNAGDPLAEIDSRPYEAALVQAQGQLARDQALLENANIDLKRYQDAFASNAVPEQQVATQLALVHQYQGTVTNDQGMVDAAQVNVGYCHLTAPISGRVGLRPIDPGNIVHSANTNPIVVITQLKPITVIFTVAEDDLPEIQRSMLGGNKLSADAYDRTSEQKIATGVVLTLDNQIDPATGTIRIRALFANDDEMLFPNQFVNIRLLVNTDTNAMLVPTSAIQRNAQGAFVYLVKPDNTGTNQTVTMQPIQVGVTDDTAGVSAVTGINPGDKIAGDNFNRLQEGAKVTERKAGQRKKPADGGLSDATSAPTPTPKTGGSQGGM
jgi:multidrug efflux system membrane fusion protein